MLGGIFRQVSRAVASPGGRSKMLSPLIAFAAVGMATACEPGGGGGRSGGSCSAANPFIVDPNLCDPTKAENVYAFRARDIDGNMVELDAYRGHVMVVVNVASE